VYETKVIVLVAVYTGGQPFGGRLHPVSSIVHRLGIEIFSIAGIGQEQERRTLARELHDEADRISRPCSSK